MIHDDKKAIGNTVSGLANELIEGSGSTVSSASSKIVSRVDPSRLEKLFGEYGQFRA